LLATPEASLCRQAKEVKPLEIIFTAAPRLGAFRSLAALDATIDYVGRGAESRCDIDLRILLIWLKEASHHVMHRRLWILRRHVEPDTRSHGERAILMDQVRILKQVKLAVV